MSEVAIMTQRADVDIERDIGHMIAHYPPLAKDRPAIHVAVREGVVTLSGYVQTPITRRYFLTHLHDIPGVAQINVDHFYDDESLRLHIARVLPAGVRLARILYGVVVLTGEPAMVAEWSDDVERVPGVAKVLNGFGG